MKNHLTTENRIDSAWQWIDTPIQRDKLLIRTAILFIVFIDYRLNDISANIFNSR
jgi:hypothetical protein